MVKVDRLGRARLARVATMELSSPPDRKHPTGTSDRSLLVTACSTVCLTRATMSSGARPETSGVRSYRHSYGTILLPSCPSISRCPPGRCLMDRNAVSGSGIHRKVGKSQRAW
jgi:hypothetical protein